MPTDRGERGIVDGVERIAVLRANGIGDYVFSVPALVALERAYPDARITLLGAPWHAGFLAGRPGPVHEVIAAPAPADEPAEDFLVAMRARRFDLALQLHGGGRQSNPYVARLGARVTVGLRSVHAAPLDRWVRYVYYQPEILRYLEVVGLVGATPVTVEPTIAVTEQDRAEAGRVVEPEQRLAVLNPGATDPRRRWPTEKFAAVGDALAGWGYDVAVVGNDADAPLGHTIASDMRKPVSLLTGRLSLGGLAGVLERADLVVSNDTGPLHLAAAVGARTIGIYWCGNLVNGGPPGRERNRAAVSWRLLCPVCGFDCTKGRCPHDASFVADVTIDEVLADAGDLLGRA